MKKIALIAFIGILSFQQVNAQNKVDQARKAMDNDQYQTAIDLLKPVQSAESQYYIGDAYMHLLNYTAAKAAFKKGIELDDDFPLNYVGLAHIDLLNKNTTQAAAQMEEAEDQLRRRVRDPRTFIEAMKAYGDAGYYDKAIAYGEKALKVTQDDPKLYVALGNIYSERNSHDLSMPVTYYERAISLDPHNAEAYTKLAVAWSRARKPKKALELFGKAIQANPNYAPAYKEKAIFYYRKHKPEALKKAIAIYRDKYLPLAGQNNCKAVTQYIQFVFLAGDAKTAIKEINKLKQNANCNELIEMDRMEGYAAYETKHYKQAEAAMKKFIGEAPEQKLIPADYLYLGKAQLKDSTQRAQGIANMYKSLQYSDTTDRVAQLNYYKEIAESFSESKMPKEAAKAYAKKMAKYKHYRGRTNDIRDMGRAYMQAKEYKKADKAFEELLKIDPTYLYGVFMRAQINSKEGMSQDTAIALYNKVIKLAKKDPEKNQGYLNGSYRFFISYYLHREDLDVLKRYDSAIAYLEKIYALDNTKYEYVKKNIEELKKRKAYIINRRKIIAERKKAQANKK